MLFSRMSHRPGACLFANPSDQGDTAGTPCPKPELYIEPAGSSYQGRQVLSCNKDEAVFTHIKWQKYYMIIDIVPIME